PLCAGGPREWVVVAAVCSLRRAPHLVRLKADTTNLVRLKADTTYWRGTEGGHYVLGGSAKAYRTLPPPTTTYCRPSSSYVIGELPTRPIPECHSAAPSPVPTASTLSAQSPVKIRPESVVSTPALPTPSPSWCFRAT